MAEEGKEKKGIKLDTSKLKDTLLNFIVPLVAFGVVAALFMLIILPSMKALPNLKQELQQKESLRDILAEKSENLKRLVDFKSIVSEDSLLVNKVLVSEEAPLPLQDQVYKMAIDAGLKVTKLSYSSGGGGKTEGGAYDLVSISLGCEGSYEQLALFMELIENAARFVQVNGFRYSQAKAKESLSVDMVILAPYLYVSSQAVTDDPIDLDIGSDEFIKFINRLKSLKYYTFTEPIDIPEEVLVSEEETEELPELPELPESEVTPEPPPGALVEPPPETAPAE
jgi:Tfp pilus assembly protein PilO